MKLRVIGWTYYDDLHFDEAEGTYASHAAIIDDIKKHGYNFTGWHHQEEENGAPVLSDGKIRRYSQRGWGGVMADVYGEDDPFAYASYAFYPGLYEVEVKMPPRERSITSIIQKAAGEMLSAEAYETLFEDDYTARFPHPELGELEMYKLTPEEAEKVSYFETVRQLPRGVVNRVFGGDLSETFNLDKYKCRHSGDRITLKMSSELKYIDSGDRVIFGGKCYTVRGVEQYKDVPEEVRLAAMYPANERYGDAVKILKDARLLIDILI